MCKFYRVIIFLQIANPQKIICRYRNIVLQTWKVNSIIIAVIIYYVAIFITYIRCLFYIYSCFLRFSYEPWIRMRWNYCGNCEGGDMNFLGHFPFTFYISFIDYSPGWRAAMCGIHSFETLNSVVTGSAFGCTGES